MLLKGNSYVYLNGKCHHLRYPFWFFVFEGPYSLNGYRVRVYRQDSATQWFTGIITHHDLFTRTMIVMNDQVNHYSFGAGDQTQGFAHIKYTFRVLSACYS